MRPTPTFQSPVGVDAIYNHKFGGFAEIQFPFQSPVGVYAIYNRNQNPAQLGHL